MKMMNKQSKLQLSLTPFKNDY